MIYIMREAETGLYKIGKARDRQSALRQRLPNIKYIIERKLGRHCTIKLEHWLDWPGSSEMDIHRFCWRLWRDDEWFCDGPELRQVIELSKDGIGYHLFVRLLQDTPLLPQRWLWKNRDRVLLEHRAKHLPPI